jgi:predicted secreted protein
VGEADAGELRERFEEVACQEGERLVAAFQFGPQSGRAQLATRVRLAGSQNVTALAQMGDASYWYDSTRIQVTLSACIDESDWNK